MFLLGLEDLQPSIDEIIDKARVILSDLSDDYSKARVFFNIAMTYDVLGNPKKFDKFINKAIKISEKLIPSPEAALAYLDIVWGLIESGETTYLSDAIDGFLDALAITTDVEVIRELFELYRDFLSDLEMGELLAKSALVFVEKIRYAGEKMKEEAYKELGVEYAPYDEYSWSARRRIQEKLDELMSTAKRLALSSLIPAFREYAMKGDLANINNLCKETQETIGSCPYLTTLVMTITAMIRSGNLDIPDDILKKIKKTEYIWLNREFKYLCDDVINAFNILAKKNPDNLKRIVKKIGKDFLRGLILIGAGEAILKSDPTRAEKFLKEALDKIDFDEMFDADPKDQAITRIINIALENNLFDLAFNACKKMINNNAKLDNFVRLCTECPDEQLKQKVLKNIYKLIEDKPYDEQFEFLVGLLESHPNSFNASNIKDILSRAKNAVKKMSMKDWEKIYYIGTLLALAIRFKQQDLIKDLEKWFEKAMKKLPDSPIATFDQEIAVIKILHSKEIESKEIARHLKKLLQLIPSLEYQPARIDMLAYYILEFYEATRDKEQVYSLLQELLRILVEAKKHNVDVDYIYEDLIPLVKNLGLHDLLPQLIISAPTDILDSEEIIEALLELLVQNKEEILNKINESKQILPVAISRIASIRFKLRNEDYTNLVENLEELIKLAEEANDEEAGIILYRTFESFRKEVKE